MKDPGNKKKVVWVTRSANKIFTNIFAKLVESSDWSGEMFVQEKGVDLGEYNFPMRLFKVGSFPFKLFYIPRKIKALLTGSDDTIQELVYFRGLSKQLRESSPDVVVVNLFYLPLTWQVFWYCWRTDTPYVITIEKHEIKTGLMYLADRFVIWLSRPLIRNASLLTAWTPDSLEFSKAYLSPKGDPPVELLPAGIDVDAFSVADSEREAGDKLSMVMVARFVPFKRHKDVIRALSHLREQGEDGVEITFLGEGKEKEGVRQLIKKENLEDIVSFHEPISYYEMPRFYANFDLLLLPSFHEPIGMVVPEAMACGVPAIVSDTAGSQMYVKDGENGYVFKTGDYKDLASKIRQFKNRERDILENRAREVITEEFSVYRVADRLSGYLAEII